MIKILYSLYGYICLDSLDVSFWLFYLFFYLSWVDILFVIFFSIEGVVFLCFIV